MEIVWLKESLFNGMTANAFKLGTVLTMGWFWSRVSGCTALFRGESMETADFDNILTVTNADANQISPPDYIQHSSDSTCFYVVRRFNNCGYEEQTLAAAVKISIDGNGDLKQPQPNSILSAKAKQTADNKVLLVWYYCPLEQKSQPQNFKIYYDNGTGQIDYNSPLAEISYNGKGFYKYQSGTLESKTYLFAIRTVNAGGVEDSSFEQLRIQLCADSPNSVNILDIETI